MAQAPTLYQFDLTLAHTDRGISETLQLRTARHPSETLARVWLRVLAFAWHYAPGLAFGPGLCDPDAPDILATRDDGELVRWIRVGKADPVKLQKVADRNPQALVAVVFESEARMDAFLIAAREEGVRRLERIDLAAFAPALMDALAATDERRTAASITIAGDHFYVERKGTMHDGAIVKAVR